MLEKEGVGKREERNRERKKRKEKKRNKEKEKGKREREREKKRKLFGFSKLEFIPFSNFLIEISFLRNFDRVFLILTNTTLK